MTRPPAERDIPAHTRHLIRCGAVAVTGLALLCAAAAAPVRAQAPDSVIVLPELRVELNRLGMGGVPLLRVPFGAQVIKRPATAAVLTVSDALAALPGVSTADVMGAAAQQDVSLRGFSVSPVIGLPQGLSVFVDGVRVNEPDMSQVYFNLIPLHAAERIEVLRGPSGTFGKNALGGSMNIVTLAPADAPALDAVLTGDSHGGADVRLTGSAARGAVSGLASVRHARSSGWRDASSHALLQTFTRAEWRGPRAGIWVWHSFVSDSVLQAGSLPRSWLRSRDSVPERWRGNSDPRTVNFTGGDLFRPTLHMVVAGGRTRTLAAELSARVFHRRNVVAQFNANFTEPDSRIGSTTRTSGFTAQAARAGAAWHAAAGAEYAFSDVDIRIFELPNENFPELPAAGTESEHVGTREHNAAAFGQVRIEPHSRTGVTAALRFDYVQLPFRDRLEPENDGDNFFRQLTGSIGVDRVIGTGAAAFASFGRGFRAPTIMELACADPEDPCPLPYELGSDPPLHPVTADTWQTGLRTSRARWSAEAVGYWTEVRNEIFNVQAPESRAGYFTNLSRTRRQGLELSASAVPRPWVVVDGTVGVSRATFRTTATLSAPYIDGDDEDEPPLQDDDAEPPTVTSGSQLPMLPTLTAALGARVSAGEWEGGARVQHTGAQWLRGDEDNSGPQDRVPAATLVSLSAARRIGAWRLEAGAENLLDAVHYRYGVLALNRLNAEERIEPFLTPGAPRRLYVSMGYTAR